MDGLPGWWEPPSTEDIKAIDRQIGRPARGVLAVAARCRFGQPMVAVVAPFISPARRGVQGVEPFPTTFWLTCPYLVARVSALEGAGWIRRLSRLAHEDEAFARGLAEAHRQAARLRSYLVGGSGASALGGLPVGMVRRVLESGVGGIREPGGVKCLHAHLADYLGRSGNPVGRRVVRLLLAEGVELAGHESCPCEGRPSDGCPDGRVI